MVDLGLIYGVDIDDEGNCLVTMTLTTAGCPLNDYLNREIRQAVGQLAAIKQVDIKLVWYPVWTPDCLSEQAKKQLGINGHQGRAGSGG
ncbi:metal-sulfur cluster assembly factor [Lactobacillus delbrueckii subsp. bulgaricus]|nr:metal-sulfur cluster assembly factor [Lactobacillus delbrueckii subsp. bulgaricus]UUY35886.1 metal-sulfur cluster assembly factor [Lactobacillus delbrueckii subsp. bulgaricus]